MASIKRYTGYTVREIDEHWQRLANLERLGPAGSAHGSSREIIQQLMEQLMEQLRVQEYKLRMIEDELDNEHDSWLFSEEALHPVRIRQT